jgi:NAD(P)-dependent dehydrogenase (short-subunit alcohol dehydrogenase family)
MSGLLDGKVVLVVGAASSIGQATVRLAEAEGATVLPAEVATIEQVVNGLDQLDVAVNAVGVTAAESALHEASESDFDRLMAENAFAVFACMRVELRTLVARGQGGSIVNVTGSEGLIGRPGYALESAAAHAVIGLTRTAALEFGPQRIRVNAVCASAIDTDRSTPLARPGTPGDVAEAVVWLAAARSGFVTGAALPVDGGTVEAEGQLNPA